MKAQTLFFFFFCLTSIQHPCNFDLSCPPRLHIPVLSRRENNLLVIKEAKRAHNLAAVCTG